MPPRQTPMEAFWDSLRDALLAVREEDGRPRREFVRAMPGRSWEDHATFSKFEKGVVPTIEDPDERVRDYAIAAGIDPYRIWLDVADRWVARLNEPDAIEAAKAVISPRRR